MLTIAVIVGSLRKASLNKKLAHALAGLAGKELSFSIIPLEDVPMYNQDNEGSPHASVVALRETIKNSDGVLFITPEYNRSLPAVLKNAIDWASRPYGKNSVAGKPAAIAGVSPGSVGAAVAQAHLRGILVMLNMQVMGQPEMCISAKPDFFAEDGSVTNEDTVTFFTTFLDTFAQWVEKHK